MDALTQPGQDAPAPNRPEEARNAPAETAIDAAAPRYRATLLRAGRLLLDGGGMFGVIPRVVWERSVTPDDKHRIE
ncbi:MAG: hypothetical protein AAFU70_11390, partial [Planctomycetota bacterium]